MSLYVSSSLLVFFLLFMCVVLFLYFHFAVPLLVFFLFFTFDLLFPFPVLPFFKTPHIVSRSKNSFHNSYLVNLVCVVRIHILYTMLAEHWSKTRLLPRDIRLGCRPDLSSKVEEKRSTATWSFTEKLAAHPRSLPISNLYIQWDLTWGVQGLWRHIAAKGPHSVQERKSSESWLETRKDEKEWKKLGKRHTIASTLAWLLHCFVCCQQSRCVHPKHLTLAGVRCPLMAGNRCQSCWKNPWKVRFKKITKVLLAAIWPVQA